MKRISFYLFAMLIGSMSLLTACSSDDDEKKDETPSGMVAGSYNGTLIATLNDQQVVNETRALSLEKSGDNAVNLIINNFTLNVNLGDATIPVSLGNLKVTNCTLTQKDGKYTFNGTKTLTGIQVPITDQLSFPADCEINIVNATVEGNKLSLPIVVDVTVSSLSMELTVNVQYDGVKQ